MQVIHNSYILTFLYAFNKIISDLTCFSEQEAVIIGLGLGFTEILYCVLTNTKTYNLCIFLQSCLVLDHLKVSAKTWSIHKFAYLFCPIRPLFIAVWVCTAWLTAPDTDTPVSFVAAVRVGQCTP